MVLRLFLFPAIYFTLFNSLVAVDYPVEPIPPQISTGSEKEKTPLSKKEIVKKKISVQIKLCDGREISGTVDYEKEEIPLFHTKDGIQYEKKIPISDVRQFYINSWEPIKQKKMKDGISFQMTPKNVTVTLKDTDQYLIQGLKQTEFSKLSVQNKNGIAYLFTYWIDLQFENGKWFSKLPPLKTDSREDCHPDVVRMIRFYTGAE
jgi:hypothetical protein